MQRSVEDCYSELHAFAAARKLDVVLFHEHGHRRHNSSMLAAFIHDHMENAHAARFFGMDHELVPTDMWKLLSADSEDKTDEDDDDEDAKPDLCCLFPLDQELVLYIFPLMKSGVSSTHNVQGIESTVKLHPLAIPETAIVGPSARAIQQLFQYISVKARGVSKTPLFHYVVEPCHQWRRADQSFEERQYDQLVGLDGMIGQLEQDLRVRIKHLPLLQSLGESCGLNFLLFGPPGTGKSSLVRAFATKHHYPIFVVRPNNRLASEQDINNMLTPDVKSLFSQYCIPGRSTAFGVVLLEDFDRYLNSPRASENMSTILNCLDGVVPSGRIIRFLTANDATIIERNAALRSRMHRCMLFDYPNRMQIEHQIKRVFPELPTEQLSDLHAFLHAIEGKQMSLRAVTHHLIHFLESERPLHAALQDVEALLATKARFDEHFVKSKSKAQAKRINDDGDQEDVPDETSSDENDETSQKAKDAPEQ
eukprot:TRINITY_DN870_c0_g1_i3.p1 TRINITY_DN870_c0_g1~~TRINITY_DN870_c0_g1_i3.p1  ORF type:complete len:479 (-),score=103.06 TRINITY_DN870_c0_g1_i3:977-2413(-)